ncbi:uncharacterized protein K452DRAFT_217399 [Aplosporella prunicola CBS 121167]|uniref:Autophagy-related protein 9 n=1 Tax=Aplosporella prunicola CBS 121167 TaxID=1176127 RepID=A0A6A6BT42_9PEZI|nr:uncharacterized protein K452DRAFT_217399 [Aplosporella prunicola CBS 121167]KAF2147160.1 hypothetical protein K452DRAFT_217399 [Aplosporella prunicola CBS 121167]
MASNFLSRLLPSADDESVYEPMDQYNQRRRAASGEDHGGHAVDEANLEAQFFDNDIDNMLADGADSHITTESTAFLGNNAGRRQSQPAMPSQNRPKWMRNAPPHAVAAEEDDDVPESLLLGPAATEKPKDDGRRKGVPVSGRLPSPVPGPSTRNTRAKWDITKARHRLHDDDDRPVPRPIQRKAPRGGGAIFSDPKEEAMWRWVNVQNLDRFLAQVYDYYIRRGIWSIILTEVLELLRLAFLAGLLFTLTSCIQYKQIFHAKSLTDIVIPKCAQQVHGFKLFLLWLFAVYWVFRVIQLLSRTPSLWHVHNFYHHLLDIPDSDIQTASWQLVVSRLMALRDSNLGTAENVSAEVRRTVGAHSKQRMDAHDIANRLMRKDNFLIALFNKDVLNLTVPLPFIGERQFYSRTMEELLRVCLVGFVFDSDGQVQPRILQSRNRNTMIELLSQRFRTFAVMSLLLVPFYAPYYLISYFLRYFSEYRSDPSQLGSRMFTPLAEWKFREFNELRHLFKRRRNMAYPFADRYLQQFPKFKTDKLCSFISFILGSVITILGIASLLYPELLVEFEITPGQTVFFWLGVLTPIFAITRGMVTAQELVFDPEYALEQVINCTHYCPATWRDRLHTDDVRKEFTSLYQLRVVVFLEEILSMVLAPLVLYTSLPKCSDRIVDFFREFTVHVDGLGHVCSFAVFDFKKTSDNIAKGGQTPNPAHVDLRREYFAAKDGKLDASIMGFMHEYGQNPDPRGMYKSNFNLPPAFPPLAASVTGVDAGAVAAGRAAPNQRATQRHNHRRSQLDGHSSPMQSILLDARHQPNVLNSRISPQQAAQTNFSPPNTHHGQMGEGFYAGQAAANEQHSIDESWFPQGSSGDGEDDDDADDNGGAGIVGLLHQLQNAHAQGRGPSV